MSKYNHLGEDEEQDTERSLIYYSDLFTALSFCFLFLYVVSVLHNSIKSLAGKKEITTEKAESQKKIKAIVENYEKLIAAYQMDKDAYLKGEATPQEVQAYNAAMAKLNLLAEEKRAKKEILMKELSDVSDKERALNEYQSLVKNIIDSNLALKKKVADKEKKLEHDKEKMLKDYDSKFKNAYTELLDKTQKESLTQLEEAKKEIKSQSRKEYYQLLDKEKKRIGEMVKNVESQKKLELEEVENKFKAQVLALQEEKTLTKKNADKLKSALAQLGLEKDKRIAELESSFGQKLTDLQGKQNKLLGQVKNLESENTKSQAELKSFYDKDKIIKELVSNLKNNFAKNGVEAAVDSKTGEVTLNFLSVYFDQGKSSLKDEMKFSLEKFMPSYTSALFSVPNISDKIEAIEIIGFASPTFDKKYIDPKSLNPTQLPAVSYNLDLSYKRAKSIFEFIYNPKKMDYKYQKEAFSISKVSGRSFLDGKEISNNAESGRKIATIDKLTTAEYCAKYDCRVQQKVVVKFYLKP